jgi:hypothetical protein
MSNSEPSSKSQAQDFTEQRNDALREGVKGLFLMNGGGAVAMLAFLQAIWKEDSNLATYVIACIAFFSVGVFLAAMVQFLRYYASFNFQGGNRCAYRVYRVLYLMTAYGSLAAFLAGVLVVVSGTLIKIGGQVMVTSEVTAAANAVVSTAGSGWLPALYAGLGAIVGGLITAIASITATHMQQSAQNRRDLVRMAVDLGMAEYAQDLTLARDRAAQGQRSHIAPLATYVLYFTEILDLLNEGKVTPDAIRALETKKEALLAAFPGYPGPDADGKAQQ